ADRCTVVAERIGARVVLDHLRASRGGMAPPSPGGRGIVIAMVHARTLGVVPGLEDPGGVLDRVIGAGADAIMTSYGVIKHYRDKLLGRLPVYLRLDGGPSIYREDWLRYSEWSLLHTLHAARRLALS